MPPPKGSFPPPSPERELLSVYDLSALLQVCVPVAYRLIKRPGFPLVRVGQAGRLYRIPRKGLDRWLAQQTSEKA